MFSPETWALLAVPAGVTVWAIGVWRMTVLWEPESTMEEIAILLWWPVYAVWALVMWLNWKIRGSQK